MNNTFPSFEDVQNARGKLNEVAYQYWVHHELFTWKWWLLLTLTILPWIIWWKLVNKKRIREVFLYGTLVSMFSLVLDMIGTELVWWGYPLKLAQIIPGFLPADISLVPIPMMLCYEYFSNLKPFVVANFILAIFLSYAAETIFIWMNYYELNSWKPIYSLLFYIIVGHLVRWIVVKANYIFTE